MKPLSFSLFFSFVVLMFTHLQAKPIIIENCVLQTCTNSISNDETDQYGFVKFIDLFDIEEDGFDDYFILKTELKATTTCPSFHARLAFQNILSHKVFFPKTSSFLKFYKSWQSFLQVFRL